MTRNEKISEALMGNQNRNVPIIQLSILGEYIKEYPSVKSASIDTGVNASNIVGCCKNRLFTAGGYMWAYRNDNY